MAVQKKNDTIPWVLIVALFFFGLWPISLVILFVKLFGKDSKTARKTAPPLTQQRPTAARQQSVKKAHAVNQVTKSPVPKKSNAKKLKIIGGILLAVGLITCWDPISMMIWLHEVTGYYLSDLLRNLSIAVAGGAMVASGISMDASLKRYQKYLAVMGDREAIATEELARTLGIAQKQVEKDLQKMLDKGYFGGKAYLNMELGYLFRSGQADAELKRKRAEAKAEEQAAATEEGYSGILRAIRRVNDEIADPELSAKIDKLESIAAQIFRIVEAEPAKAERITTFFNYYLPTTQKLLDSYAKFESAGIEGENLRQAKERIESPMDSIVHGFEYQLDELYKSDALDVDRDIRVMETMLNRDTASAERDFGLNAQAAQEEQKK